MNDSRTMTIKKTFHRGILSIACALSLSAAAAPGAFAQEPPTDPDQAQFLGAMEQREKGNLYEAMDIFSNILSNKPLLHRARLELAVTYYRLYDYEKAKQEAQKVLDDPKTPENVRVAILAFMAQIDKDSQELAAEKHYWKPTVALGWMHDTNVNVGLEGDSVATDLGVLPLDPGSSRRSDSAAIFIGSLNHRYQTGKTFRAGEKNGMFLWQSQGSYYRRDYFDEHAFDLDVVTLGTGPSWISVGNFRANVNAQIDYIGLGSEELAWFYSLMPSFTKQYRNGAIEWTLDGTVSERDYVRDIDQDRDSTYWAAQLSMGRRFTRPKIELQIGGRLFLEDAATSQWRNDGNDIFAGASWEPWTDGTIFARINETTAEYDGPATGFTTDREDSQTRYTIGASQTLRYKWLNEWTVSGNFSRTENNSNASTYEWTRKQVTFMLSKTF